MITWLQGKKTYIIATLLWIYGAWQSFVASGGHGYKAFIPYLFASVLAYTIKAGQARIEKGL